MEARMLSLFDDEDFLPQEKPKPAKPKKSPAKKEQAAAGTETDNPDEDAATTAPEEATPETTVVPATADAPAITAPDTAPHTPPATDAESELPPTEEPAPGIGEQQAATPEQTDETADGVATVDPEPEIQPETTATDEPVAAAPGEAQPGIAEQTAVPDLPAEPVAATPAPPVPEDDELNRQILSELILSDYTALIHKEYPFDLKHAEVVKKDREVKVPDPVRQPVAQVQQEQSEAPEAEQEEEDDDEPVAPLPEWDLDKRYYTIGEVAQLFKVNTSHIRFWTNEFKLRPRTTRKGDRLYSPEDIAQLRLIHHLVKEKKHTIKGAKEKLKAGKEAVGQKLDLKDSLVSLKEMLIRIKEQL